MMFYDLEEKLIQFSFVLFLMITLFSWMKILISDTQINISNQALSRPFSFWSSQISFIGICSGFISITALCIIRWNLADHLPLSNLYESSLFLSWSFIFLYLLFKLKIKNEWLDTIIAPIILITTTFSSLGLPKELQESTALVPALQSNWLMMHVTMMILSYGALIFGSLLAVTLLTLTVISTFKKTDDNLISLRKSSFNSTNFQLKENKNFVLNFSETINLQPNNYNEENENIQTLKMLFFEKNKSFLMDQIDYWSYRIIGIGFPLLTLGILSGAVWANEAWGSYWSWDPKETWALITWVIFAIYLHTRITKGWNGTKPALVAVLGFFVVWICYLGVNLLGKGLHSYGWLN